MLEMNSVGGKRTARFSRAVAKSFEILTRQTL